MLALDQVAMIIDSTGTDELQSMSGAAPGYRAVSPVIDTLGLSLPIGISYRIEDGAAWELGVGRITAGGYLERTRVTASSASGSRINIAGDPDPAIMYIVACALSAPAVTPHVEAWSPALGAQVREDIEGGTALGAGALVFQEDGTSIGAITGVSAIGATAVGLQQRERTVGRDGQVIVGGDGKGQGHGTGPPLFATPIETPLCLCVSNDSPPTPIRPPCPVTVPVTTRLPSTVSRGVVTVAPPDAVTSAVVTVAVRVSAVTSTAPGVVTATISAP